MLTSAVSQMKTQMNSFLVFKYLCPQLNNVYHHGVKQQKQQKKMSSFIIMELSQTKISEISKSSFFKSQVLNNCTEAM